MAGSGPRWFGPTDRWPAHPKPWFRAALDKARAAGWWYREASGSAHIHGTAFCQHPDNRAGACRYPVFSSGAGGETKAQEFERNIDKCPHNSQGVDKVAKAAVQLDKIERLCEGVVAILDQYRHEQNAAALLDRAEHLLEEADEGAAEVDDLLSAADQEDLEAQAAADEAEQVLALASTDLRDPGGVLDLAEETTSRVRSTLKTERPTAQVRAMKTRVRAAQAKIRELRSRVDRM